MYRMIRIGVLTLGYFAGQRAAFYADQAAGLSELVLSFALPASLWEDEEATSRRIPDE